MVKKLLIYFLVLTVGVLSLAWFLSEELALWRAGICNAQCMSQYAENGTKYAVYCGNDEDGAPMLVRLTCKAAQLWKVDKRCFVNEYGYAQLEPRNEGTRLREEKPVYGYVYCGPFDADKVRKAVNINNLGILLFDCGHYSGMYVRTIYPQRWEEREIAQLFRDSQGIEK